MTPSVLSAAAVLVWQRRSTALMRATTSFCIEGLDHVVVRAQFQAQHLIKGLALGREHHHRRIAQLADAAADFQTVHSGHHHIQQDHVRLDLIELFQTFLAVVGDGDLIALLGQIEPQQLADIDVVIHDKDLFVCHECSSCIHVAFLKIVPQPGTGVFKESLSSIIRNSYDKIKKVLYDFWDLGGGFRKLVVFSVALAHGLWYNRLIIIGKVSQNESFGHRPWVCHRGMGRCGLCRQPVCAGGFRRGVHRCRGCRSSGGWMRCMPASGRSSSGHSRRCWPSKSCSTSTTRPPSSAWPRRAASSCWRRRRRACPSTSTPPCR